MKILQISNTKKVKKSKKEYQKDLDDCPNEMRKMLVSEYKSVPSEEPIYFVEMSAKEYQLVSFYLELEHRKPIMNVEIDAQIKKEKK